jgi:hypothetical protein
MERYSSGSVQLKLIFLIFNFLICFNNFGQEQIDIKNIFNDNLDQIIFEKEFNEKQKDFLLIAPNCCYDCVKYFDSNNLIDGYIIILTNASLVEIKSLKNQIQINSKNIYFILTKDINSSILSYKNLYLIHKDKSIFRLYNYETIVQITNFFQFNRKIVRKNIKNLKIN